MKQTENFMEQVQKNRGDMFEAFFLEMGHFTHVLVLLSSCTSIFAVAFVLVFAVFECHILVVNVGIREKSRVFKHFLGLKSSSAHFYITMKKFVRVLYGR